ncbi:hypothetical protein GCM10010358_45540 [Streptomyces minutiscleroticus]|uniref:Uncharacterized protein n=1 Tax=Streptomyces minutiscleroticus TaxID=68238 RepID=A0A918U3Q7_9ACTN|nr:hypothetical protein GCM10010358_45540 [Streptomyces minutiscleroticus]
MIKGRPDGSQEADEIPHVLEPHGADHDRDTAEARVARAGRREGGADVGIRIRVKE